MNHETILKVEFEIAQVDKLLNETMPLLKLAHIKTPDMMVETAALGLFLHSFYNGIENIIKFIIKEEYGKLPSGNKWHKELLDLCFMKTNDHKELFSEELKIVLDDYLSFRHFIRNTYSFKIKWERMEYLILNIEKNWNDIKTEIINYIK
ncbi:MAG: hypothetical protein LBB89_01155 [Treponema sp.]|jgi:hypothetical protein|nr:hypothetical protein [Treponema sp.]